VHKIINLFKSPALILRLERLIPSDISYIIRIVTLPRSV
jgi:hypothetical protein